MFHKVFFVPGMGVEPTRPKDTWPSTMPVYQFQHPGRSALKLSLQRDATFFLSGHKYKSFSIFTQQINSNMSFFYHIHPKVSWNRIKLTCIPLFMGYHFRKSRKKVGF